MKKEYLGVPLYDFLFLGALFALGIIFGSIFDWQISSTIVQSNTFFGRFVESFGFLFGCMMIDLGGVMIFKGLYKNKNLLLKILGYILLLAALLVSSHINASYCKDSSQINVLYGFGFSTLISYLIGFAINITFLLLFLFFIKSENKEYLIRAGIAIILTMIMQYLFIHFIKRLDCRPRYRFLVDPSLNTTNEVFRNWWEFHPFSFSDDFHKSWPSGHTGTASVAILLPLIAPVIRHPFKYAHNIFLIFGLGTSLFVAFFRVYHGAHFLSDVSFGALFTLLFSLLNVYLSDRLFRKKKDTLTENLS